MRLSEWNIKDKVAAALAAVSLLFVVFAMVLPHNAGGTDSAARRCERAVEKRMALLETYVERPGNPLPEDMVIYRYAGDTLQSWRNQFPVSNDAIGHTVAVQRLMSMRAGVQPPLADVDSLTGFYNFGPKWYLAKMIPDGENCTIIGLEIRNSNASSFNGANPKLGINDQYSIKPLSSSEGSEVLLDGRPMFKIANETLGGNAFADAAFIWMALVLILAAALVFVFSRRTLRRFLISAGVIVLAMAAMILWGNSARESFRLFSPTLYAGGQFLSSLGTVLLVNLGIVMIALSLYIVRSDIGARITKPAAIGIASALDILAVVGILAYVHISLRSIILDSSISLELYKFGDFTLYSSAVYVSFVLLLVIVPMLLQLLQPAISHLTGHHVDMLGVRSRVLFSILIATYLVISGASLGFDKEKTRLEMWANRLTLERDMTLELQLRRIENQIAADPIISSLAVLDNTEVIIQNRILESYPFLLTQDYDLIVRKSNDSNPSPEVYDFMNRRIRGGTPIADDSRFLYNEIPGTQAVYTGVFMFYNAQYGITRMILSLEPKAMPRCNGYSALLGITNPGQVALPAEYSYARYAGTAIRNFRGNYPYPVELNERLREQIYDQGVDYLVIDGHSHFFNVVSDGEVVVITRPKFNVVNYVIAGVCLALLAFLLMTLLTLRRRNVPIFETNHYKTRITWVLMISLLLTLVTMATVSVVFVYRRNEDNLSKIMSDKINAVQALVQEGLRSFHGAADFSSPEVQQMVHTVSTNTSCDITLYAPDGLVMTSTTPEVFERQLLGIRINEDALDYILTKNKRYYIHRENLEGRRFYSMYAPIFGPEGIVAILCSPYTEEHYDFERDAVMHSLTIITLFLILLILARFMISAVVDRMFKPLSEMGRKMSNAGLDSLELIEYDRNDEITTLVNSYNRMVKELSESTRKLAQAERDKAWSGMARQVAHEIKNPLTPMKLQIQRIMRLKAKNAPNWEERFDEMAKVLLDHIDILTDTANEFSTFAKLYTEEPTEIDLDKVLQEEIAMFDNREDVKFDYIGMPGTVVSGPKPQLTRVFVNLIGNAVQAVEGVDGARVVVSLRNSTEDGFYDIVVEDNGPGVSEENISKLFTPNFTTKSGGSGLGLAISRSILERCGARIRYSRSFVFGGACFTITYPNNT